MRYVLLAAAGVCLLLAGCSNSAPTQPASSAPAPTPSPPPQGASAATSAPAAPGAPPETLEFPSSRDGNVTFTHRKHIERVNGDCSTCHPRIFTQTREPINYGKALHRAAEARRTACAACHAVGGSAFAADSNCPKCHQMRRSRG